MTAEQAMKLVIALEDLTDQTGNQTMRSQNKIIRSLPDDELVRFAVQWKQRRAIRNILSGNAERRSGDVNVNAA